MRRSRLWLLPRSTSCVHAVVGHAAGATAGAEPAFVAGKCYQPLEVAFGAAHPEKAVLKTAALQEGLEVPANIVQQGLTVLGQFVHEGGVVCFDELVEQRLGICRIYPA